MASRRSCVRRASGARIMEDQMYGPHFGHYFVRRPTHYFVHFGDHLRMRR